MSKVSTETFARDCHVPSGEVLTSCLARPPASGQDRWHNFTFLLDGKESKARVDELTLEVLLGN